VAWRNGADVELELWPIEAFGGVSDEQFWDDLAADKPAAMTARAAQADSGPSRHPAKAYPPPRPGATARTAGQPAAQPVQVVAVPAPIPTQPYPAVSWPPQTATKPVRASYQPGESRSRRSAEVRGQGPAEDPLTSPAFSLRAKGAVDGHSGQPSSRSGNLTPEQYETALSLETLAFISGRATEARPDPLRSDPLRPDPLGPDPLRSDLLRPDPLRSDLLRPDPLRPDPLRPDPLRSGGHRADPLRSDGHRTGSSASVGATGHLALQPGSRSAGRHAGTAAYPFPWQPHSQPTTTMSTPPSGERHGYRNPVSPIGDRRRANGSRGYSGPGGNGVGGGNWAPRHAYPLVNGYHGSYGA
jgi:hypothetical protein